MAELDQATIARFMQSQQRAKKLIDMDARGVIDNLAENARKDGRLSTDDSGDINYIPSNNSQPQQVNEAYTQEMATNIMATRKNSKLPKAIIESFAKNNIDTSLLGVGVGQSSVLDMIDHASGGKLFNEQKSMQMQKVVETVSQPQNVQVQGTVDYSLIKTIVEDCVKKYTSALRKSMLNESKSSVNEATELQAMKIGDKFSFIDKNGNLYEAKLEFIKNIKQK